MKFESKHEILNLSDTELAQHTAILLREGGFATIALAQSTKKLAGVADKLYKNKELLLRELTTLHLEARKAPLDGGMENPINEYTKRAVWGRRWAHFGFNTFKVDENLLTKLILTDPPAMPVDAIRPPFEALRIEIPPGILPIASNEGNKRWVRWIDTLRFTVVKGKASHETPRFWDVLDTALSVGEETANSDGIYIMPRWTVWAYSDSKDVPGALYAVRPTQDTTVKDFIDWEEAYPTEAAFAIDEEEASIRAAIRVVLNLCIALDAGALKPCKYQNKRREQHRNRGKVTRPTTFHFRASKVNIHLVDAARAIAHGKKSKAEWRVKTKFIVRGHWRWQACGPKWSQRKRTWIEAFWKGPDTAEGYTHLYEGKEP